MLQNFQQQPVKPETNLQPPMPSVHTPVRNVSAGLSTAVPQPLVPSPQPPLPSPQPLQTESAQQKSAFDKVTVCKLVCIAWIISSL